MRITTYEKGGNSLNPFIRLFVFLIILGLFVMPVSAFEDDFNDNDMTDWVIGSGTWSTKNTSSILGGADYYGFSDFTSTPGGTSTNTEYVTQTIGDFVYFEFDVKQTSSIYKQQSGIDGYLNAYTRVYFSDTDYFQMRHYGSGARTIDFIGFTYTPVAYTNNAWYHIEMTFYDNNNIKVDIYKDDALVNSQTATYLNPNDNTIKLYSINADNYNYVGTYIVLESDFDNIVTSESLTPTINGVEWVSSEYVIGEQGRYEWSLSDGFWADLFTSYSIVVLKDGEQVKFSKVSQVGRGFYNFESVGEYTVKIRSAPISLFNIVWSDVDTDTTRVYDTVDSSIFVPQTVAAGVPFDIEYNYGFTPLFPRIIYQGFENGEWNYISSWKDISSEDNTLKTTYYVTDSLSRIGEHRIILADDEKGEVASIVFNVIFVDRPIEQNVTTSLITVDDNTLYWGEFATGTYKIDNYNYSNYLTRIDVYDETLEYIVGSISVNDQVNNYYTDFIRSAGNKSLQLIAYNITNNKVAVLDSVNISVTSTTAGGYSLRSNVDVIGVNQEYTLFIVSPSDCELVVYNIDSAEPYETFDLAGSIALNLIAPDNVGKMLIRLRDNTGKTVVTIIISVIGVDVVIIEDTTLDTTFQDNTTDLLNSPYLIGLFIMCVFLAIGATNGIGGTIVTGSIGLGIVCYMGIFPWILLVIEVLVVAVLMAKGMINLSGD